jgi:hypothetical protein
MVSSLDPGRDLAGLRSTPRQDLGRVEVGVKPDAWAIHFGPNGEFRAVVWDDEALAEKRAVELHGTIHPMGYLDGYRTDLA